MTEIKSNLICTGCSLLCDDIVVELENGRIVKTHHVCARGYGRYYQVEFKYRLQHPTIRKNGQTKQTSYHEALKEIINLLKEAKKPFFYGWGSATSESQQSGIELARKYQGRIDCASTSSISAGLRPLIDSNIEIPKLPDIKDNADILVFLGSDPTASHIRLLSKYALLARGANTDRGIEDRIAITIDIRKTDMSKFSQEYLEVAPGKTGDLLEALTKIIDGKSVNEEKIANIARKEVYEVANLMKDARYGVIFVGEGYNKTESNMKSLVKLLTTLNQKGTKFGAIPLNGGYNATGFYNNLKDRTQMAFNADFQTKQETKQKNLLLNSLTENAIDFLFLLGADPISNYPFHLAKKFAEIPIVCLDFQRTPTTELAQVVIPVAIPGVESGGTAMRLDMEPVVLKKVINPPEGVHPDAEVLSALLEMT